MKKMILLLCAFVLPLTLMAHPKVIILLRHAEEPTDNNDKNLSPQGILRAEKIPYLFAKHPELKNIGKIDYIFAAGDKNGGSKRSLQTAHYLSKALNIEINALYQRDNFIALAKDIRKNELYDDKVVVVVWKHSLIREIAEEIGVKNPPAFPDRYDRIWKITYEPRLDKKDKVILNDYPQKLMPGDSQK